MRFPGPNPEGPHSPRVLLKDAEEWKRQGWKSWVIACSIHRIETLEPPRGKDSVSIAVVCHPNCSLSQGKVAFRVSWATGVLGRPSPTSGPARELILSEVWSLAGQVMASSLVPLAAAQASGPEAGGQLLPL